MEMYDLSVIIPTRNEMFLARTVQDILENSEAKTEIIITLDGDWADPGVPQNPRVNVTYVPEAIGQRAAANLAARLARGKYVMKVDGHCAFDKGFDRKMIEGFAKVGDNMTMVPVMRNLWAFDWKCQKCGKKVYQDAEHDVCPQCGVAGRMKMKLVWYPKPRPQSWSYHFDAVPHFQYFEEYKKRPSVKEQARDTGFTETMSLQGSCFMATREKYWELNMCDENLGNWGNQGIEVALKTWLSGGRVLANHNTWYAHLFRTKPGRFGFPYPQSGRAVAQTKQNTWNLFFGGQWKPQIHPVSWLVKKFWPVPGWSEEDLAKLIEREQSGRA